MPKARRNMLMSTNVILALVLIGCFQSCSSTKIPPQEYKGDAIIFGNGGGFSGIENSIVIHENGEVYRLKNRGTTYEPLRTLKSSETDQLFKTVDFLGLWEMDVNNPDNTYRFVELKTGKTVKRLVWSSDNTSKELQIFYRILNKKTQ